MGTAPLDIETVKDLRAKALDSLYVFTKGVLGFDWLVPHIHGPLCKLLENNDNKRLRIVIPRGWLKTTVCSISYPLWRAVRNPSIRILLVQNTHTNAVAKMLSIKAIVDGDSSPLFKTIFPEIEPGAPWKGESLCLVRNKAFPESTFEAAGIRTQVTSRHYDIIIEDDTVAPDLDEMGEGALIPSKQDIEQAIGYHRLVPPLLTDPKRQIIVVGTRWYERDLLSWIEENEGDRYTSYERSCRELKNPDGTSYPAEGGLITYPERFDEEVLDELKTSVGPYSFSCLYLNTPLRSSEMLFLEEWMRYYDTEPRDLHTWTTVDPGGDPEETKGEPDYCAIITAGKDIHTGRIYILDKWHQKANPGELIEQIFSHVKRWSPLKVGFENVALQKNMLYFIKEKMREDGVYFILEGINHSNKEKNARIQGLQPLFGSGNIFLKPHMQDIVSELLSFPLGKSDDLIDTLAMQVKMWSQTVTKKELGPESDFDPMSVDSAIEELRERNKPPVGSIMDIHETQPVLTF